MTYIAVRGRWCDTVMNVHEDKTDDTKDSSYKEPERVLDQFPKYHIKILLGDFNANAGREDILKPRTWNESLHEGIRTKLRYTKESNT
jgi:hypothetical protein